jgi:hypothetical protein
MANFFEKIRKKKFEKKKLAHFLIQEEEEEESPSEEYNSCYQGFNDASSDGHSYRCADVNDAEERYSND